MNRRIPRILPLSAGIIGPVSAHARTSFKPLLIAATVACGASLSGGCTTPPQTTTVTFDAAEYPAVFQAAKDTLREYEFELERVDARLGVITTRPRPWAGLATPWIPFATDAGDAVVGLIQPEQRACRVRFEAESLSNSSDSLAADLRASQGPMRATVEVVTLRLERPGRRIGAPSVRMKSQTINPEWAEAGLQPAYVVEAGPDHALAVEIADALNDRRDSATPEWVENE